MTDRNSPAAREPAADRWVTLGEAVAAVLAAIIARRAGK